MNPNSPMRAYVTRSSRSISGPESRRGALRILGPEGLELMVDELGREADYGAAPTAFNDELRP
jgi:hypothetical protein